jgi:GDP-4-dehydro-6-deoxy-D-mannose reductase
VIEPDQPRRETALITGASGFVGRHLVNLLRNSTRWDLIGLQAHPGGKMPGVRLLVCDLLDAELTNRVIERHRPDVIFHLAAQAYVPKAVANPAETLVTNAVAQANVLESCRAAGISPIIVIVSSAEVYGAVSAHEIPISEHQTFQPRNPYAVSKITQDMLGLQYFLSYEMNIVRVRPFNHIGPGQNDRFVVSSLARQIAEIELDLADPILLVGNLDAVRDFLDVRDVVCAYLAVCKSEFRGEVFNVASGTGVPISSILHELLGLTTANVTVRQDPSRLRPSDIPTLVGDASKLRAATGWRPSVSLQQSLGDTLDYWRRRLTSTS